MEPTEGYDIGLAVSKLRRGYRVVRKGWNGKGMWLEAQSARVVDGRSWLPFVLMSTVGGALVPWLCSQTDLLANDWEDAGRIWEAATATAMCECGHAASWHPPDVGTGATTCDNGTCRCQRFAPPPAPAPPMPPIPPVGPAPYVEIQTPATSAVATAEWSGARHTRSPGCCAAPAPAPAPLCKAWPEARADDRCGCNHVLTMHVAPLGVAIDQGYGGACRDRADGGWGLCPCQGFIPPPERGRSPDTLHVPLPARDKG